MITTVRSRDSMFDYIVVAPARPDPVTRALIAAAQSEGIAANDGFVDGNMDGAGLFRVTQAMGKVVLAAGAIGSPHRLLLSGVGPAAELVAHGIPVVQDLPGVGQHLQDHVTCGVIHHCREPVTLASAQRIGNVLRYLVTRTGPLSSNVAEAGAFVRIRSGADRPELELLFAPTFFVDHGFGNPPGHGSTVACILLHPESTGSVSLGSADPAIAPTIVANYDGVERELDLMVQGMPSIISGHANAPTVMIAERAAELIA